MQIAPNSVAEIDYTLTGDDGQVLDSTEGRESLAYLHGAGTIIPGLENALSGKQAGDEIRITLQPEDGYGVRDESLLQSVPAEQFAEVDDLQIGMRFRVQMKEGPMVFTVMKIADNQVTVDGNHPLAGKTLHFDVKVQDVRDATAEEIAHGHVHGPGGRAH